VTGKRFDRPTRPFHTSSVRTFRTAVILCFLLLAIGGLTAAKAPDQSPGLVTGEGQESEFKLRVERNVVLVRVVVRDSEGKPIRNLTQDDFELYDNGKRQVITQFSADVGAASEAAAKTPTSEPAAKTEASERPVIPNRFAAFYFDDLMMKFEEVVRTRDAAERYFALTLQPGERVGIFTSSGQGDLPFTADRDKLHEVLAHLRPRGRGSRGEDCPDLSNYEAYQIAEHHDPDALQIATQKLIMCQCGGNPSSCPGASRLAEIAARRRWEDAENQLRTSLRGLEELVRRMTLLPGRRSIVMVSPGFIPTTQLQHISQIIDGAVRAGVVINALDSRGLYAMIPGGDASQRGPALTGALMGQLVQMDLIGAQLDSDVLSEVADGTGGVFFHNNNDFDTGFRQAGALESTSYLLSFSPEGLKQDGKYHVLKVKLSDRVKEQAMSVQARRGYFAPRSAQDAADQARQALAEVAFSRDETSGLLMQIQTQTFKLGEDESKLSVVARVDARSLRFEKQGERNVGDVTFVTVVFDGNGNYVDGAQKTLHMRLRDETLQKVEASGIPVQTDFNLPPGTYLLREVVRDSSGVTASKNLSVQIPD
jgi:VWFA-related protein